MSMLSQVTGYLYDDSMSVYPAEGTSTALKRSAGLAVPSAAEYVSFIRQHQAVAQLVLQARERGLMHE